MCHRLEMDAVTSLLDGPRAQRAFVLQSRLMPPWCLRIEDEAPLTLFAAVSGSATVSFDDGETAVIGEGGVAIVRGPDAYSVADATDSPLQAVIGPGQVCTPVNGSDLRELPSLGARVWGTDPTIDVLITGSYGSAADVSLRLLEALPRLAVISATELDSPLLALLASEVQLDSPGQEAMLDRLLDLLLIAALRVWFTRSGAESDGWAAAWTDPIVGRAIRLLQANLGAPWTVAALARAVAVSRASLARRFTELVGEPPMTFLRTERLRLAADLLRSGSGTLDAVATTVGYGSAFALSAAFSRERGESPSAYRSRFP